MTPWFLHRVTHVLRATLYIGLAAWVATPAGGVTFEMLTPSSELTSLGRVTGAGADGSFLTGHTLRLADWAQVGFTWSQTNGMEAPLVTSLIEVQAAEGISADGRVVAAWRHQMDRSAVCLVNGTEVTLANAFWGSSAMTVDPAGTLVAGATPPNNRSLDMNAAKWNTSTGTRTVLGDLAGGALEALALATSADGGTIVGWGTSASGREAFRHTGSTMSPLGDLTGGQFFSEAVSVSSNGAVIVGRSMSADGMEAFRWTSAEGMVGLGDLPGGAFLSEATGVSDDGQIIVGASDCEAGPEVFVYDASCGMRSLRSILSAAGVDVGGWNFADSRPVLSGDGDVLAGRAVNQQLDVVLFRFSGLRSLLTAMPEPLCSAFVRDGADAWTICFTGEAGLLYQVEYSTNLSPPAVWQPMGDPVQGCGVEVEIPCSGAESTDARYYRLVARHTN